MGDIGNIFNLIFSFPIFNALIVLYRLFGDFGLSIIVLTLLLKLILFPLTLSQLKSMRATQALQPRMAEIRKKYAKDQQAQAQAMQELYKEYGINPLAGCLPLFIQLPVLYGLYEALRIGVGINVKTTQLKLDAINGALYPFIPHFSTLPNIDLRWFTFLSPAFHFSLANPDPTHILPILAGIATFVQLRMSQSRTAATASANGGAPDPTTQSMKMMQYIMPIFTVFIGWTFPAGLALYWTVSSIFQAVQQFFVTGWGALAVKPDLSFLGIGGASANTSSNSTNAGTVSSKNNGNTSASNGNSKNNGKSNGSYTPEEALDEPEEGDDGDGPIAQKVTVPQRGNSSSSARRRQGSSSARRRSSNNKQRRKVSSR